MEPIRPIPVVAPSPSILTSARPLSDSTDWSSGVSWSPAGCIPSFAWPRCPGTPTDKELGEGLGAAVSVDPFWVYTPISCDWVTDGDRVAGPAADLTEAHTAAKVSAALWMGEGLADGALSLRHVAQDVSIGLGGASDLDDVVAALLANYERCTGGSGGATLHIPSVLIPGALGGIPGGGRVAWPEGNFYRGPLGSVVSPGPGYPHGASTEGADGHGPLVDPGPPAVYAGNAIDEAWVYVSGPVEWAASTVQVLPDEEAERRNLRLNRYEVWAERMAIVRFDPCCVFAALAVSSAGAVS